MHQCHIGLWQALWTNKNDQNDGFVMVSLNIGTNGSHGSLNPLVNQTYFGWNYIDLYSTSWGCSIYETHPCPCARTRLYGILTTTPATLALCLSRLDRRLFLESWTSNSWDQAEISNTCNMQTEHIVYIYIWINYDELWIIIVYCTVLW